MHHGPSCSLISRIIGELIQMLLPQVGFLILSFGIRMLHGLCNRLMRSPKCWKPNSIMSNQPMRYCPPRKRAGADEKDTSAPHEQKLPPGIRWGGGRHVRILIGKCHRWYTHVSAALSYLCQHFAHETKNGTRTALNGKYSSVLLTGPLNYGINILPKSQE